MEKELIVKCDFCGKEIPCPESMLNSEKHSCLECFKNLNKRLNKEELDKVHVAIPREKMNEVMPEILVTSMMEELFPEIWHERKYELKEMKKKALAEEMFALGAMTMAEHMIEIGKEIDEEETKEQKERGSDDKIAA